MTCAIVLLSWSWCDLCTTMSHAWRTYQRMSCMFCDFSLSWNRTGARRHDEGPLSFSLLENYPERGKWLGTEPFSLPLLIEKRAFKTTLPCAPPQPHRIIVWCCLPSAFGASLPAREQTGNNGAFPVHPVRVVLSGSWWCENWHLVLYVWPLTHRTVNAI